MDFTAPKTVDTNGISMEYFEQGEGTPVVFLHGFPELAYSWRKQLDPVAAAGYRVIAPNLRGFGGSDAPADSQSYAKKNIVADLTGMLDALGLEQAVFVGHDFGGFVTWYTGVYAPDRVLGLASCCTPFFPPGETDLLIAYDEARGPNHYMNTFQEPGVGEALLERDVEHTFRELMRGSGYTLAQLAEAPKSFQETPAGVFVGDPQLFGEPILTDEEIAFYVDAYERSGFTGGLNWYRSLHRDWEDARRLDSFLIDRPALMIAAANDWFLPPEYTEGMEEYLPQLEKHLIADAGHWVQQEHPEQVNQLLLSWLQRNFG